MVQNSKEPGWYDDPETLKTILAIVLAALIVKFVAYFIERGQDDRAIPQPQHAVIRSF